MDEINDFFDFSKPFIREPISGGYINGRMTEDTKLMRAVPKREVIGTEYVNKYQEIQREELMKAFDYGSSSQVSSSRPSSSRMSYSGQSYSEQSYSRPSSSQRSTLNDLDSLTGVTECSDLETEISFQQKTDNIYEKYNFTYSPVDLPIMSSKSKILETISENPVTILQGSTGCGKTTQVPQFILDDALSKRQYCNIIITQPRRIAAISIATRVCAERKWDLGTVSGYQVGLVGKFNEDTRLLYCTTGILLEKLIRSKSMSNYTHVILDEVHERDQDMDFLFIIVRKLLSTNSSNVKIILMSATIEAHQFAEYFRMPKRRAFLPAPIINVEQKSLYDVKEFYLCKLNRLRVVNLEVNYSKPCIADEMYDTALKLIIVCERLDVQDEMVEPSITKPSILIFLPGIHEIDMMHKKIITWENRNDEIKIMVLRLHSTITHEEQNRVFKPVGPGYRKIILSTNIAESSITVPDIKYVIDFCLTKSLVTDTSTNFTSLQMDWASRNNCRQRSGRAGRVMNGRVYRLVPKNFYDNCMVESSKPEILRSPLENVVLKSKILDMGPPQSILALAMDQPKLSDIDNTILILKEVGALLKTTNGILTEHDGDLTFIGRVMGNLPVDIRIAKLIIFGHCFSVLEECIIIGAGLNVKSIFSAPFGDPMGAYSKKLRWSDGSGSDLFAILKAYRCWSSQHEQHNFNTENAENLWTKRYFLQIRHLKEMSSLVTELKTRLQRLGIKERTGVHRASWTAAEKSIILKVVISGAFYPNYFLLPSGDEQSQREAYHTLNGRDPCNTVYFTGFDQKYIGPLYTSSIKDLLKPCIISPKNMFISFDNNTEKIFVNFRQNKDLYVNVKDEFVESVPGQVATEVYKACKMRKIRMPTTIRVLSPTDAVIMAENKGLGMWEMGGWVAKGKFLKNIEMICIPRAITKRVHGVITYIDNFNRFWFRAVEEDILLRNIFDELNHINSDIEPFSSITEIAQGQILAAPYDNEYHRAKIEYSTKSNNDILYKVYFIDFGIYWEVPFSELRRFRGVSANFVDIPPRIFECRLAELQPSSIHSEKNVWTDEAVNMFLEMTRDRQVCAEIYSVVNGVSNVYIKVDDVNINKYLIKEGMAQKSEENYMSKADHEVRVRKQMQMNMNDEEHQRIDEELLKLLGIDDTLEVEPPPLNKCHNHINLRGPFSPLESKLYAAIETGLEKSVTVEPQSVNSVLLNSDPQDSHEKLLVAASITESSTGNQLTARQTTLMPNIPGFGALMALIFCPCMEILRDKQKTRYVSILTGLGYNPETKDPLFAEHDIVFKLDAAISLEDLSLINQIRFAMDALLMTAPGQEQPMLTDVQKNNYTHKIKNFIIRLLEQDRSLLGIQEDQKHTWGIYEDDDVIKPKDVYGQRAIFPFHSGVRLLEEDATDYITYIHELNMNCKELHRLTQYDISLSRPVNCQLCNHMFKSIPDLKIHLFSRLHRDRERQINYT